ncbi:SDR family oxidoreductase [Paenibacillus sp.]|uniref:SDR family NAD(P)-dependent oxidoreductase n=1 Tax=Paenibacillus sp. TaxID=58172 RepID=UPI00283A7118|nr:SDR family oxidoreductase [Paenibacillus sp.]MDR0268662.1 SDR family oxidoreductase [Paenibacillus sp.]
MNGFQDKVVMITGASKGLGKSLTMAFARKGAQLAICARGEEALIEVKREAERLGAKVLAVSADVSNARDVERFVALTEDYFGRVDVLINNASILGISPMPLLIDYPEEDFAEVLKANVMGPFLITKRVLAHMLQRNQGSIVNVTSAAGNVGYAGWGAYGVSKFALEGLTQTWADECSGTKVRINMVDPGEMDTEMHALAVPDCDYELNSTDNVVDVFLYLASEEACEINGQRLEAASFQEGAEMQ